MIMVKKDMTLKEVLMSKDKEIIINLYLSAKPKADKYEMLVEIINQMVKENE